MVELRCIWVQRKETSRWFDTCYLTVIPFMFGTDGMPHHWMKPIAKLDEAHRENRQSVVELLEAAQLNGTKTGFGRSINHEGGSSPAHP